MPEAAPRRFCFVHAADLHLDTPFDGVHAVAPRIAAALREASLQAFDEVVELARRRSAAFLLVAGDVYDGAERGLRAQLRFRDGLARLAADGIESFVVHGNHDPVETGWSAVRAWPEGVKVFGTRSPEVVPVARDGEVIATVQGISYARRATTENLALRFCRPEGPGLHVGLLHCNVAGAGEGHDNYSPCSLDDLRRARLDYWALGHVHSGGILAEGSGPGDPWVVYPGNTQARSGRRSERGPKGAVVVHVEDGRVLRVEQVACDRVRFVELECPVEGLEGLDGLEQLLDRLADEALEQAEGRSLVLRARLAGRGPLHDALRRTGAVEELLEHLREGASDQEPFLWWDEIADRSLPPQDLGLLRGRGDFASDLLSLSDELKSDRASLASVADELVGSVPRYLARDLEELLADGEQLAGLLALGTLAALDELAGGEP